MFWKKYKKTPGRPSKKPREKHLKKDLARLDYRHLNFRLKNKCEQKCTPGGPKGLLPAVDSKKGTEKFSSLGAVTQPRHCTLRLMGTIPKSSRSWQKMVPAKRTSKMSRRIHDESPLTSDFEYVGYHGTDRCRENQESFGTSVCGDDSPLGLHSEAMRKVCP